MKTRVQASHLQVAPRIWETSSSPVNNPHTIDIEQVFGVLKYSDLQGFAVFGRFSCDLGARLREGGSMGANIGNITQPSSELAVKVSQISERAG